MARQEQFKHKFFSALWPPLSPLLCIVSLSYALTRPPPLAEIPAQPETATFSSHQKDNSLKDNIPSWSRKGSRQCLDLDCINCQLYVIECTALHLKKTLEALRTVLPVRSQNTVIWVALPGLQSSNLARIKFSTSFIDWLSINFHRQVAIIGLWKVWKFDLTWPLPVDSLFILHLFFPGNLRYLCKMSLGGNTMRDTINTQQC